MSYYPSFGGPTGPSFQSASSFPVGAFVGTFGSFVIPTGPAAPVCQRRLRHQAPAPPTPRTHARARARVCVLYELAVFRRLTSSFQSASSFPVANSWAGLAHRGHVWLIRGPNWPLVSIGVIVSRRRIRGPNWPLVSIGVIVSRRRIRGPSCPVWPCR